MTEISAISLLYQKSAPEITGFLTTASLSSPTTPFVLREHLRQTGRWLLLFFNPKSTSIDVLKDQWKAFESSRDLFTQSLVDICVCVHGLSSLSVDFDFKPCVLLDDESHKIGKAYEVLLVNPGTNNEECSSDYARAIFLISPQGIIRHISLYDEILSSHDVEELLSLLRGFQTLDKDDSIVQSSSLVTSALQNLHIITQAYSQALRNSPLLTKSVTSAMISIVGELIGSFIYNYRSKSSNVSRLESGRKVWEIAHRVIVFGIYGLSFTGPFFHWWYRYLHQLVSSWSLSPQLTVIIKVLLNQLVVTPPFLLFTIGYLQFFLTFDRSKTIQTLKNSFVTALFVNWKVWTVAQAVNFGIVPIDYQVLFGNLVALWWNIYLSLIST